MIITLSFSNEEAALIKNYAQMNGVTVAEFVRKCVPERLTDKCDLTAFNVAMAEYREDTETYTVEEVEKEIGLS